MLKFFAAPPLLSPFMMAEPHSRGVGLETAAGTAAASGGGQQPTKKLYPEFADGPRSPHFKPLFFQGNVRLEKLAPPSISEGMKENTAHAPQGEVTSWGIPFRVEKKVVLLKEKPISLEVQPFKAKWLVFLHTTDIKEFEPDESGFFPPPFKGAGLLGEHVADYEMRYEDGTSVAHAIHRRHQINTFRRVRSGGQLQSVAHRKPSPVRAHHEQTARRWGSSQCRARSNDVGRWLYWLWAWENPHPEKAIAGFTLKPQGETILLSAISTADVGSNPLRWQRRQKALFTLPSDVDFDPELDRGGLLSQIQIDMGQVISALHRPQYPNAQWAKTYDSKLPEISEREILIEYTAHPDAMFHLFDGKTVPVAALDKGAKTSRIQPVAPADQQVLFKVVEKKSRKPVPVKLHIHGKAGEYLPPIDRHRIPNPIWFEDYSVDYLHRDIHNCTYIPGETVIKLPVGKVYVEVSKGFEIKPVRKVLEVTPQTEELTIEIEKVLDWREKGWVTADTHVHFLSPGSALLEGAGEGVNVVNLLASQWGELMTNVGDFDGKTTYGSKEAGGDGEYLVRVGTENRQHILGHISLLGYEGRIIAPMTTGGPPESAIGDPVEVLLTEWAEQCKKQGGVVIIPHFPNPRSENAASIVSGHVDGVEMTSWGNLYAGIDPYSLSDWYRYLNCGYFVAAVGGTDKMTARTAVGTIRTYAKIENGKFDYDAWKMAIGNGHTFVTYGPLLEFAVDGKPPGSRIKMSASGGTVDVTWKLASCTVPMSHVELVVNGEIREKKPVHSRQDQGYWRLKLARSSWAALLVRGHYADKPEIIAAHSSPVMIAVKGSEFFAAADAVTILEQIEGALAFVDTVGIRPKDEVYKRMRMKLESVHRKLHNRLHQEGQYHMHSPVSDHHNE